MRVLVFGQTGQVAAELRRLADTDLSVTSFGRDLADLREPEACAERIRSIEADAVINAAAYTAVDAAESNELLAHRVNCEAPGAMAGAAAERRIPFLHISTDYVFDGHGEKPFAPNDPVSPLNAYGRSKLAGELAIESTGVNHAILRTSWVFSSHGSNFVKSVLNRSKSHKVLNVVEDQIGGPTAADDIARCLIVIARALVRGQTGGIYHYSGHPFVNWKCFAQRTLSLARRNTDVRGVLTKDYPTAARRPLNSRLDCTTTQTDFGIDVPSWSAGLARVIKALVK